MKLVNLIGKRFQKWVVIERVSNINNQCIWRCRCDCGQQKNIYGCHLKYGKSKSCGCLQTTYIGKNHPQWNGVGDISGSYYVALQANAGHRKGRRKNNPMTFNLSMQFLWDLFIKQNKRCALSGMQLTINYQGYKYNNRPDTQHTASLDRIDSSKEYTQDNVQWVHKDINFMKRDYEQNHFIEMCKKVAKNNQN